MSSKSNRRALEGIGFASLLWCVSLGLSACSTSGSDVTGTGGGTTVGSGGTTGGSGGATPGGSGGSATSGSGGSSSSGGNGIAAGSGGDTGTAGAPGLGGDTGGDSGTATGGAGGMSFLLMCNINQASGSVFAADKASNAPIITDFTYTNGNDGVGPNSIFFGDTYNEVTGLSYHFPDLPVPQATGGAGGDNAGPGGQDGAGGGQGGVGGMASGGTGGRTVAGTGGRPGGRPGTGGRGTGTGGRAGTGGGGAGLGGAEGDVGGTSGGAAGAPGPVALGLHEDLTASNWHITGEVGQSATAFVLQFQCLINAAAYDGIEFTIQGSAGTPSTLSLQLAFGGDETGSYTTPGLGLCSGVCQAPSATIPVTSTVTKLQLPWSRFTGGRPLPSVDPTQLARLLFAFTSKPTPYAVDVTIDSLHFFTAPPPPPTDAGMSTD
jgi:hypothetical protein